MKQHLHKNEVRRFSVLGSRFWIPGSRFSVLGSGFPVPGPLFFVICSLFSLTLAACGTSGGPRPGYIAQQQTMDSLTITLERPQQAEILKDYELFVTLANAAGQPVDGAMIYLDLDMPGMPMGSNQPLADPLGGGQYRIKGVFTMEGDWRVSVHATVAGKEYAATFDQPVTLPE